MAQEEVNCCICCCPKEKNSFVECYLIFLIVWSAFSLNIIELVISILCYQNWKRNKDPNDSLLQCYRFYRVIFAILGVTLFFALWIYYATISTSFLAYFIPILLIYIWLAYLDIKFFTSLRPNGYSNESNQINQNK